MKPEIFEAEWQGQPTFLIVIMRDGKPWKALWKLEGINGGVTPCPYIGGPKPRPDAKAIWTNRIPMAWHDPNRKVAEEALRVVLEIEQAEEE